MDGKNIKISTEELHNFDEIRIGKIKISKSGGKIELTGQDENSEVKFAEGQSIVIDENGNVKAVKKGRVAKTQNRGQLGKRLAKYKKQ